MLLERQETLSCDVLVIGGGGAGLRSAIAAKAENADVLLVSKSGLGRAANTFISKSVIAATGWGTPDDTRDVHMTDTVIGGRFLNDQAMVARMVEQVGAEIAFLKECGVRFGMEGEKPRVFQIPGHSYPRHVYGENWIGRDLVLPLERRARKVGVRVAEHVFVSRFLASGGRVSGATGVTADGRFLTMQAKTIVLATGGYAQIFLNTNNAPGIAGDGHALAYDLGVPLKEMEFVQFYPTAMGERGNQLVLYEKILPQTGVVLRNEAGEDILRRNGLDPLRVTRDQLAQLVMKEIGDDGRERNGVFMDLEALPEEIAGQLAQILPSQWWKGRKTFKVAPTAHFCMGGVATDEHGETCLNGLFVAGEAAAGMHGANRLGGNALAEVFAMGSRVGGKAAQRAREIGMSPVPRQAVKEEKSRLEDARSEQGSSPKRLARELKELMWYKAGVIRREDDLREALRRFGNLESRIAVASPADLIRLMEFQNMRLVAEMVCRAALERTESRGSHFRVDYPEEDNRNWLKNIVLRKGAQGMEIQTTPVRLDRVKPEF
ncbi:MAG: FAD-binding protein [Deltaproteobacteria bacterium]|nr:FAD-binding protein [Deltaproteobacteria bacterium]